MAQINQLVEELKEIYREKSEEYVRKFENVLAKVEYPIKDANVGCKCCDSINFFIR